jgi:hypothetical protein
LYRALCAVEDSIPVFSRDWWLDAACGDDWEALLKEKDCKVYAAMPLYVPCKHIVSMPHYTQTMGIWFAPEAADTKYSSLLGRRRATGEYFIKKLDSYKSFLQNFSHEFTDWLPFYWEGYAQTTRYTYILHDIKNFERLWLNMSRHTRRNVKKAEEEPIVVRRDVTADDFLEIQEMTFKRQHKKNTQSDAVLRRLIDAARERGQGEIFGGYDCAGRLHAAAFVVWQKSSAYYIAGGGNPALRSSGAHGLVMWNAIKYASRYTDTFDFEGSMIGGVERFFREFGAVQTPYFVITRGKPSFLDRAYMKLKYR